LEELILYKRPPVSIPKKKKVFCQKFSSPSEIKKQYKKLASEPAVYDVVEEGELGNILHMKSSACILKGSNDLSLFTTAFCTYNRVAKLFDVLLYKAL